MRYSGSRHTWRHYTTFALIAVTGALSALFCTMLILVEVVFRLFIMIGLLIFGVGAVVTDYLKKKPRLN